MERIYLKFLPMSLSTETQESVTLHLEREHKLILEHIAAKHCMPLHEYLLKLIVDTAREAKSALDTPPLDAPPLDAMMVRNRPLERPQLNLRQPPQNSRDRDSRRIITPRPEKEENWLL